MIITACIVRLYLPTSDSLKAKRGVLKSILARVRREFNVAAAETSLHDVWQSAEISLVTVSTDAGYADGLMARAIEWIERNRPEVEVVDSQIEVR
ncbi:MAG: DUF503 domain-containing protein [Chloroflexi bacterium]|nr:DUF503 domain-containing protein [Chloroflexota bacterium]MBI3761218.1 DUF503 domain-containing protein [Chloroflexota bacterium]